MSPALLAALIAVESGGRDHAIGDGGRAVGPLQIHAGVVEDVNRRYGTHYRHSAMTNRSDAVQVCRLYLRIYAPGASDEVAARVWNGGPQGARRASTLGYWSRVRRQLAKGGAR